MNGAGTGIGPSEPMAHHESKYCQRCDTQFECKVGTIAICQCSTVTLSKEERGHIEQKYDDCLCANCLKVLRTEHKNAKHQRFLKKILGIYYKENHGNK